MDTPAADCSNQSRLLIPLARCADSNSSLVAVSSHQRIGALKRRSGDLVMPVGHVIPVGHAVPSSVRRSATEYAELMAKQHLMASSSELRMSPLVMAGIVRDS